MIELLSAYSLLIASLAVTVSLRHLRDYQRTRNPLKFVWVSQVAICFFFFTQKASQSGTRRDCFRKDTRLTDSQASLCKHYKYSGVDRGHMAPNGDFDSSNENDEAWMDTYLLSNIAPQYHGFNVGKGKKKKKKKTFIPKDTIHITL